MARQSRTWAPTFLQILKIWLKQLVEDQWHQERVGEQIDLVNGGNRGNRTARRRTEIKTALSSITSASRVGALQTRIPKTSRRLTLGLSHSPYRHRSPARRFSWSRP